MEGKITILIVSGNVAERAVIRRELVERGDFCIVGEIADPDEAGDMVAVLLPNIVLVDMELPMANGLDVAQMITRRVRNSQVVMMANHADVDIIKTAMLCGAREYITRPFDFDQMADTIRTTSARERRKGPGAGIAKGEQTGRVIVVAGSKGGIGKSTVAVNTAVAIRKRTNKQVLLMDLDLQFGDVPIMLDIIPKLTISELIHELDLLDEQTLEKYLIRHSSGIAVLAPPYRPEYADYVNGSHVERLIRYLRQKFDYIVVDTPPHFGDTVLSALDAADLIAIVTNLEMTTLRDTKLAMEILLSLRYSHEKVRMILNKSSDTFGIGIKETEKSLGASFWATIPTDLKTVVSSVNMGQPFVVAAPRAKVSLAVEGLAQKLIEWVPGESFTPGANSSRQRRA
jgi:pilus assembly protein CpaE